MNPPSFLVMSQGVSTRSRLVDATIESLDQGGEAAVRVSDVASRSDVTTASIYHFFSDRDGLIVAAQVERYRRSLMFGMADQSQAVRRCTTRAEFLELIDSWMRTIGSAEGQQRRRIRIEVLGSAASRPELRSLLVEVDKEASLAIGRVIEIAQDKGWTGNRFDPNIAALWWFGMMNGRYLVEFGYSDEQQSAWDDIAAAAVIRLFGS